jgi:m7GpppX diphosphatase
MKVHQPLAHLKISVICPATDVHIRKASDPSIIKQPPDCIPSCIQYSKQTMIMVHETPELYQSIVQPYINAFPAKRVQWYVHANYLLFHVLTTQRVKDILSGNSEADKVLYSDPNEGSGFLLIPDMKWDLTTVATLYLVALVRTTEISSMRDLRKEHVGLLCRIRGKASRVCKEKWGLQPGELRMFIHYQPSYCKKAFMS